MSIVKNYEPEIKAAIKIFWETRASQILNQQQRKVSDAGMRGAVTGGKQMDGFITLFKKISLDFGVPEDSIYLKGTNLPGFFRPTKDWDLVIISPQKHLIACLELKSQVGSFGNNFNNRSEEAIGSAVDLWTAFREGAFPNQQSPWVGYLMVVEKSLLSSRPVSVGRSPFRIFDEFINTSYLERYKLLCKKLSLERHYSSTSLIWTSDAGQEITYGYVDNELSFSKFIESFAGYITGKLSEFGV
ncbi:MAG TPA: PaeR7I family type II restriction endonuclease [Nitrososphaeraceae archaeon]